MLSSSQNLLLITLGFLAAISFLFTLSYLIAFLISKFVKKLSGGSRVLKVYPLTIIIVYFFIQAFILYCFFTFALIPKMPLSRSGLLYSGIFIFITFLPYFKIGSNSKIPEKDGLDNNTDDKYLKHAIIALVIFICIFVFMFVNKSPVLTSTKESLAKKKGYESVKSIVYNYPENLSGKTKEEILEIRKKFVQESIFADENYTPSEEVFGHIVDGKPWMSLNKCKRSGTANDTEGPSEEGRFIYNPSILVALDHPFSFHSGQETWCTSDFYNLIPTDVFYNKSRREIVVVYPAIPYKTRNDYYEFNGVNARDLGYKYVWLDLFNSTVNPSFINEKNISNNVGEFQNFIDLSGSCKVEGGCNNGSSNQPMLQFGNYKDVTTDERVEIYLKLWKEKPASPQDVPDISERIILEKY